MSAFLLISESFTLSVCLSFRLLNFLPIFLRQLLTDRKEFQTFNGFYREVREISFFSVGCWCQIKNLFANILITKFTEKLGKFSLFFCWLLMSDQETFCTCTFNFLIYFLLINFLYEDLSTLKRKKKLIFQKCFSQGLVLTSQKRNLASVVEPESFLWLEPETEPHFKELKCKKTWAFYNMHLGLKLTIFQI